MGENGNKVNVIYVPLCPSALNILHSSSYSGTPSAWQFKKYLFIEIRDQTKIFKCILR